MERPVNLKLQDAVNQMVVNIFQEFALVLIDTCKVGTQVQSTICLDHSIITGFEFTEKGFLVQVYLNRRGLRLEHQIEIDYAEICEIVCYYEEMSFHTTLYRR